MAYAKISFEHPEIGIIRKAPVGFSWTTLFFGPLVCLFRKDWIGLLLMLLIDTLTFGVSIMLFPFFYNKLYIKRLLKKGYKVASTEGANIDRLKKKLELVLPEK